MNTWKFDDDSRRKVRYDGVVERVHSYHWTPTPEMGENDIANQIVCRMV